MFRIASIDAYIVAVPLATPIKMASFMIAACDNLIVRVSDGEGGVGWGEASSALTMTGETAEGMIAAIRFIAPRLEGREVAAASLLGGLIEPVIYGNQGAKSALDMALLDLIGQHQNQPLYEIFGGRRRDRAAILWMVSGAPDEIEMAGRWLDQGYRAFKVKVGALDPEADLGRSTRPAQHLVTRSQFPPTQTRPMAAMTR